MKRISKFLAGLGMLTLNLWGEPGNSGYQKPAKKKDLSDPDQKAVFDAAKAKRDRKNAKRLKSR